jgi:hypothetical protein
MSNLIIPNVFGMSQEQAIIEGSSKRRRLLEQVERISNLREEDRYRHTYIFSPPGLGKTYSVIKHLEDTGRRFVLVSGNVSMFAFGLQLCCINFTNTQKDQIVIVVDDVDEIFKNEVNCNVMKNVLSGNKRFVYEKALTSQFVNLSEFQKEAIRHHQYEVKSGFEVPTNDMVFVFTSNFRLPIDDEVRLARSKSNGKSLLMAHKNAIRSRCKVADFDLNWGEMWGWIADVVLNTECLNNYNITECERMEILDFLWSNWGSLTERSIRVVEKMAETLKQFPDNYKIIWEFDYFKNV